MTDSFEITVTINDDDNLSTLKDGDYFLCAGIPIQSGDETKVPIVLKTSNDYSKAMKLPWTPKTEFTLGLGTRSTHFDKTETTPPEPTVKPLPINFKQIFEIWKEDEPGVPHPHENNPDIRDDPQVEDHTIRFKNHIKASPYLVRIHKTESKQDLLYFDEPWIPGVGTLTLSPEEVVAVWFQKKAKAGNVSAVDVSEMGFVFFKSPKATIDYNVDGVFGGTDSTVFPLPAASAGPAVSEKITVAADSTEAANPTAGEGSTTAPKSTVTPDPNAA